MEHPATTTTRGGSPGAFSKPLPQSKLRNIRGAFSKPLPQSKLRNIKGAFSKPLLQYKLEASQLQSQNYSRREFQKGQSRRVYHNVHIFLKLPN